MKAETKERPIVNNLQDKIRQFRDTDAGIKEFFFAKLAKLMREGNINNGEYPRHKKDEDILCVTDFYVANGRIQVCFDIHWTGDVYDRCSLSLTEEEWESV